jgi:hypothetical protein
MGSDMVNYCPVWGHCPKCTKEQCQEELLKDNHATCVRILSGQKGQINYFCEDQCFKCHAPIEPRLEVFDYNLFEDRHLIRVYQYPRPYCSKCGQIQFGTTNDLEDILFDTIYAAETRGLTEIKFYSDLSPLGKYKDRKECKSSVYFINFECMFCDGNFTPGGCKYECQTSWLDDFYERDICRNEDRYPDGCIFLTQGLLTRPCLRCEVRKMAIRNNWKPKNREK